MPVIVPNSDKKCMHGHRMIFRTVPLPGAEKLMIMGCEEAECPYSTSRALQRMAVDYGIKPMDSEFPSPGG